MKLWIDDIREAPVGWIWAKNFIEAVEHIVTGEVEEVSFDHDLGLNEDGTESSTGYTIALFYAELVENETVPKPTTASVHSMNPVGRQRIQGVIDRYLTRNKDEV